uniref:CSON010060 protein n=1 Tax=Culicoides sonorensis TaxID=179676 RepID=A0A336MYV7_CULSO
MAKAKKSKKNKSDKLYSKRSQPVEKKLNPFEMHINKEKHKILNKTLKNNRGFPGKSRDKAFKNRQETLGQEYLSKYKSNTMIDHRSDGYEMSGRQHKRTAIYNLNDEEVLTHKGQTLEQIERYDAPELDHDDSGDERLDSEFTEAAHFGGDGNENRDRKSVIDELIAESKRRKAEKIKENEQLLEITQVLDENWKNLVPLVGKMIKHDEVKEKPDEYDRTMRELIFERRGEPTNPLKSKEDLEKEENERLRKLELERERRMRDENDQSDVPKHKSADDLDDGYFAEDVTEENDRMLAYEIDGDAQDNENEEDSDQELNGAEAASEENNEENGVAESDENEGSDENEESESESEDNLDDLKESESDSNEEDSPQDNKPSTNRENIKKTSQRPTPEIDPKINLQKVPGNYHTFTSILQDRTPKEQGQIIAAMIRNNNIFPVNERKDKLLSLFAFILQQINDLFTEITTENISENFKLFNQYLPHLYTLAQQYSEDTGKCLKEVLREKQETYKKRQKFFPGLDTIIFFKIISVIYSTSDFRHPIVTPAVIFLSQILTRSRVNARRDIGLGLFLVTIFLEFSQLSKRILPACFNFLNGILYLCIKKRPVEQLNVVPPFRNGSNLLTPDKKVADSNEKLFKMIGVDLISNDLDEEFKLRALVTTLGLIVEYLKIQEESPGLHYFVRNSLIYLEKLDKSCYPETVGQRIDETIETLKKFLEIKVNYLVEKERKPKALRQIDPKIEKVFDGARKHKVMSKVKAEREKLMHKFKREKKGALREIRRDNEYLTKLKLKQQIESDRIRQDKVKRIYSEAFNQQGELNAMKRKNKR